MFITNATIVPKKKDIDFAISRDKYFSKTYNSSINFSEPSVDGGLNDRLYTVNVLDDKSNIIGTGIGKSKKKAEQYACKDTLIKLGIN